MGKKLLRLYPCAGAHGTLGHLPIIVSYADDIRIFWHDDPGKNIDGKFIMQTWEKNIDLFLANARSDEAW